MHKYVKDLPLRSIPNNDMFVLMQLIIEELGRRYQKDKDKDCNPGLAAPCPECGASPDDIHPHKLGCPSADFDTPQSKED